MLTVTYTKGLPGSGKSTWAKTQADTNINGVKIVNMDLLRIMFDNNNCSSKSEKFIKKAKWALVEFCLLEGKHVILDNTNLTPTAGESISGKVKEIATKHGLEVTVEMKNFTDVPLEVCLKRDLKRPNSVGEKVIRRMYEQFIDKPAPLLIQDETLEKVLIVDIDGTVAKMHNRGAFEWDKVTEDLPKQHIINLIEVLGDKYKVIFLSGRDGICREGTERWICAQFKNQRIVENFELHMKGVDDNRKDTIIKQELFDAHIRGKYYVEAVFDDRNMVVELWRKRIGLTCLQVEYGDF
jgi:predicted kinase